MGSRPEKEISFTAPAVTRTFDGLLLDFDGTIVDSTAAIVKHWHWWVWSLCPVGCC